MKRVILVRHAKSISYGYDQDYDRTLTDRGEDDAAKISEELKRLGVKANLIIASPAVRTTQTAKIYAQALGYDAMTIRFEKKLYSGKSAENFLAMLQELEDEKETIIIFGHNPTVYDYLHFLLGDFTADVPTCSTVGIDFKVDSWSQLAENEGTLAFRLIPDQFN
ncbi:MAG: histidine phosphatase family protein [Bacteroidia bacterium]|nr:histidine phosphatase family protein [Bacteroidia bacterium]